MYGGVYTITKGSKMSAGANEEEGLKIKPWRS